MLYQGLLENMAYAKGCIERKDMVGKGKHLSKSMSIIFALQSALDMEVGEISLNLYSLYDYMHRQLTDVLVRNDAKKIDEVDSLLTPRPYIYKSCTTILTQRFWWGYYFIVM